MDRKDLMELLEVGYQVKRPYFIWGSMGIGKSYTVKEFARKRAEDEKLEFVEWNVLPSQKKTDVFRNLDGKFLFIDLRASEINLDDFKIPKLDGDYFEWKIPMVFALVCQEKARGILFFDEFNLARPNIQSMFYQLINDRQIGEHKLSDGIYVIGAGNNAEDSSSVFEMSKPLLDRFEHVELGVPALEEWEDWAVNNGIDADIIGFLNFKPNALFSPSDDVKSFATPRGWEHFNKAYAYLKKKGGKIDYDVLGKTAYAFVGGYGFEFASFVKLKIGIKMPELLDNPNKVKEYAGKSDLLYSIASSLVGYAFEKKESKEVLNKVAVVLDSMPVEYGIFGFRMLSKMERGILRKITSVSFSKYAKYFEW